jgi:hypothetical protein
MGEDDSVILVSRSMVGSLISTLQAEIEPTKD